MITKVCTNVASAKKTQTKEQEVLVLWPKLELETNA